MKTPTLWDKIKEPFQKLYWKVEYFFAKRYLDSLFGEKEYWGEYLSEHLQGINE